MATPDLTRTPTRPWAGVFLLTATLWPAAPACADTVFGDVVVNFQWSRETGITHGYGEFRFAVTNRSATDAHRVTLTLPKYLQWGGREHLRFVRRTVRVKPKQTVQVVLRYPNLPFAGNGLEVAIDGKTWPNEVPVNVGGWGYRQPTDDRLFILQSQTVPGQLRNDVQRVNQFEAGEKPDPKGSFWNPGRVQWITAQSGVQNWSTRWLSYSGYDGIVVTSADLGAMPAAVQAALWQYVESGGVLLILGPGKVPRTWQRQPRVQVGRSPGQMVFNFAKQKWEQWEWVEPALAARLVGLLGSTRGLGPLPAASALVTGRVSLVSYPAGFGQCLVSVEPDCTRWRPRQWRQVVEAWEKTELPWRQQVTAAQAHAAVPVVKDLAIPARGLFVVMLLFAVVIGPVNLHLLARHRRRIWMLWTVPVLSLLTSAGVLGYMFLSEGWQGRAHTEGITFLDQTSGRAATLGRAGYYTPLAPRDGLHFGLDTELTPILESPGTHPGGTATRTLVWGEEQHLASGWLAARVPAYFLLRKSEVRPERVTVKPGPGGALAVENHLGAAIRRFWLADAWGRIYTASAIPTGGRAALTRRGDRVSPPANRDGLRQFYQQGWLRDMRELTDRPQRYLLPGCYLADLEGTPFIEEGLRQAENRQGRSVVYGIWKEPRHAD
jgi:hypothetical protein